MKKMMTYFKLLIIVIVLSYSCSNISNMGRFKSPHKKTTPELEEYRIKVRELSEGKLGDDRPVGFISKIAGQETVLGRCILTFENLTFEIDIIKDYWYSLSERRRILLMAHEFVHCQCNDLHTDVEYKTDGCPKSFMNPYLIDEWCARRYYHKYISEMKKGCNFKRGAD